MLRMGQPRQVPLGLLWGLAGLALAVPAAPLAGARPGMVQTLWIVGAVAAAVTAALAIMVHVQERRKAKVARRFDEGEYLARWTLTPAEWRGFASRKLAYSQRRLFIVPLVGALIGSLLSFGLSGGQLPGAIPGACWGAGAGVIASLVLWLVARQEAIAVAEQLPEVCIGLHGIRIGGKIIPIGGLSGQVDRVEIKPGSPAILVIHLEVEVVPGRSSGQQIWAPIPAGHEPEAQGLATLLRNREGPLSG